jgi:hypothetical protein
MGTMEAPERCYITEMPTENIPTPFNTVQYSVEFNKKQYSFMFELYHKNSDFVERNKYVLKGLLINGNFPFSSGIQIFNNEKLERIINEAQIPRTPKSKLDSLILYLYDRQDYAGAVIDLTKEVDWDIFLNKLYFKNYAEYWFYLNTLRELNMINYIDSSSKDGKVVLMILDSLIQVLNMS